jgi:hypothetical protein
VEQQSQAQTIEQRQSRVQTIEQRVRWLVGAVAVLAVLFVINRFFIHHPLWDWIQLLIVPAILAGGGLWFNTQQREREQRTAERRAQDDTLQAYLDGMSHLLADKELHSAQPGDSLSTVARARTLTVLGRLDGSRKGSVLQFLYESGLIHKERILLNASDLIERQHKIVSTRGIDLNKADLRGANPIGADLREANLIEADLRKTDLRGADLSFADLRRADLSFADLRGADLSIADLREANLSYAREVTNEQLTAATFLEGATMPDRQTLRGDKMPDGPTLEDWIRNKKAREEAEEDE